MSQPNMPNFTPNISLTRDDVVNLLLASIAMEEMGLSHIINAEGEKIQFALGTLPGQTGPAGTLQDILAVNESTQSMMETLFKKEMILESKMKAAANIPTLQGPTGPTGATGIAGSVASVNGVTPGPTGNVALTASQVGAFPYTSVPSNSNLDNAPFITPGV
ncbi:hypothetical protein COE03_05180, partial [Bacillus thuringiensis]